MESDEMMPLTMNANAELQTQHVPALHVACVQHFEIFWQHFDMAQLQLHRHEFDLRAHWK